MQARLRAGVFCLAMALLVVNVVGLFVAPARHPLAIDSAEHKQGLQLISAREAGASLARLTPTDSADHLQQVTAIIASGLRHYWPEEGEYDPHTALRIHENWAVALLGWTERALVVAGILERYRFARLERLGYERILNKGVGFCSQASLALASYLTRVGLEARLIGLDGHVVVASRAGEQDYLLDPDYNVVIRASLEQVEAAPSLAERAYLAAGYSPDLAAGLATIYGPAGNYVGGPASYHPRHANLQLLLPLAKWGLPVIALLLLLIFRNRGAAA